MQTQPISPLDPQLTQAQEVQFLTELQKFAIMGTGLPHQQAAAREWFREHYLGLVGKQMAFQLIPDLTHNLEKVVLPSMSDSEKIRHLESTLADRDTSIEILQELVADLQTQLQRGKQNALGHRTARTRDRRIRFTHYQFKA